ncbi:MAG TPA: cytochrome c1 [Burkholderiales bacterium]|nr:cytochrome c1 [Burkholderiales bacterium]
MRAIIAILISLSGAAAMGAETGYRLDRSPHDPTDLVSLQSGARTFANYCLGCHGMQYMRYNRLRDLGLTEDQIRDNLMFTAEKVGEMMKTPMSPAQGKAWFGVPPPDLSVIARVRGADWLYTYLRTFYRDPKAATGWNNAVFQNVAMPHALWTLQGERALQDGKWVQVSEGALSSAEYDATTRDLVNFLVYAGEPSALKRRSWGIIVLFVLGVLFIFTLLLKKAYWKDVK